MPKYRATITLSFTRKGVVELEAEDEDDLEEQIAEEGYFEDKLSSGTADAFIEDIECLDEDPAGAEDT